MAVLAIPDDGVLDTLTFKQLREIASSHGLKGKARDGLITNLRSIRLHGFVCCRLCTDGVVRRCITDRNVCSHCRNVSQHQASLQKAEEDPSHRPCARQCGRSNPQYRNATDKSCMACLDKGRVVDEGRRARARLE